MKIEHSKEKVILTQEEAYIIDEFLELLDDIYKISQNNGALEDAIDELQENINDFLDENREYQIVIEDNYRIH